MQRRFSLSILVRAFQRLMPGRSDFLPTVSFAVDAGSVSAARSANMDVGFLVFISCYFKEKNRCNQLRSFRCDW